MIEHNLTLAWRQLVKYRLQSAVSVVSLAIGFACFALASMWIKYETTYDGFHRDADRMYFLATDHSQWGSEGDISISINSIFGDTVYKNCPEIVECTLFEHQYFLPKEGKGENYIACDSSFLDFFDINILVGDRGFLRRKDEIAITRQKAEEWWPGEDPLGKELEDKYGKRFVVTAIVEGWGAHTNLPFIFLSGETEARKTHYSGGEHVVRLAPQADVKSINERLDTLKSTTTIGARMESATTWGQTEAMNWCQPRNSVTALTTKRWRCKSTTFTCLPLRVVCSSCADC